MPQNLAFFTDPGYSIVTDDTGRPVDIQGVGGKRAGFSRGQSIDDAAPGSMVDYRAFGSWLLPDQDIGGNWQLALDQLPSGSMLVFGKGQFLFSEGATVRKRVGVSGMGYGTKIWWEASQARDVWVTADGINAPASEVTDELQLDGFIARDMKIRNDRSVREHVFRCRRVDNGDFQNISVIGIAGSSLIRENCREFSFRSFRERFCGYMDKDNPHLSDAGWQFIGPPSFIATTTSAISGTGSQTFSVSNTIYTDPDGVILGLSVGAGITINDGTPGNSESVVITAINGLNVTAVVTKPTFLVRM